MVPRQSSESKQAVVGAAVEDPVSQLDQGLSAISLAQWIGCFFDTIKEKAGRSLWCKEVSYKMLRGS